jgi:hypothetical protein
MFFFLFLHYDRRIWIRWIRIRISNTGWNRIEQRRKSRNIMVGKKKDLEQDGEK